MRFDPLLGQDVEEEVERLFYTAAPARFVHIALLKGLNSPSVPGRLAASSLLLGAGAAALLGRLDPPQTSCCSTQLQGSTQLMSDDRIKYKVIDQVLAVPGLAPATGDRLHLRSS